MFKSAGFDLVEAKLNVTANDLRRTLREFGAKSRDADVAVIYYAGHGIELDGTNYLIPVDASLETDAMLWEFRVDPSPDDRICADGEHPRGRIERLVLRSRGQSQYAVAPR